MTALASAYFAASLYAHRAHNLVAGASFFADHDFLGSLYETYDDAYDALVERLIGLGQSPNLVQLARNGTDAFARMTSTDWFTQLLRVEEGIRKEIDSLLLAGQTQGTQNLLQGLADESEARTYKINQRT